MTPSETLAYTAKMLEALKKAKSKAVFVGLPSEKVGGEIYDGGETVITVGATHEYGAGGLPKRSFLRAPFLTKQKELNKSIAKQFESLSNGKSVDTALGLIGVVATNISKGAFVSLGYGTWKPITQFTAAKKGSNQTLIDTGTLRNSITWVIRDT